MINLLKGNKKGKIIYGNTQNPNHRKTMLKNYLNSENELMPQWLANYQSNSPFPLGDFLKSRVIFYPGSRNDGQPIALFAGTHHAHTFIYADYDYSKESIIHELNIDGFNGYTTIIRQDLTISDLVPRGWNSHILPAEQPEYHETAPYGFLEILERKANYSDNYGTHRFAVLFLGADGVATFDALFCQVNSLAPHAIVLQDHGFGGNYTSFGKGGLMARIANRCNVFPKYLLVAQNTTAWIGYERVSNQLNQQMNGENNRYLWKKSSRNLA